MSATLRCRPVTLAEANAFVDAHHAHHGPSKGHRWSVGVEDRDRLVGVAIVSDPRAQALRDKGRCLEVVRCATDRTPHAASKVLAAAARAALSMGCRRVVTYTRIDEDGTSVRAAGFHPTARVRARDWTSGTSGISAMLWLPGLYTPTTEKINRIRWERGPDAAPEIVL